MISQLESYQEMPNHSSSGFHGLAKIGSQAAEALPLSNGFDWSIYPSAIQDNSSESDSSDEDRLLTANHSTKAKTKRRAYEDLTATAPNAHPESVHEFDRALLASPNSSFLWIQYMSFLLQLHEVEKARRIGRQALEKISYREEQEKLNVWMALINLELGFGSENSAEAIFKEAAQYNDSRAIYLRYVASLQEAGKEEVSICCSLDCGLTEHRLGGGRGLQEDCQEIFGTS